jgi:hypothetical protein
MREHGRKSGKEMQVGGLSSNCARLKRVKEFVDTLLLKQQNKRRGRGRKHWPYAATGIDYSYDILSCPNRNPIYQVLFQE